MQTNPTNHNKATDEMIERIARAMDFNAWDALDSGRDLIRFRLTRAETLRHAKIAITALEAARQTTSGGEDVERNIGRRLAREKLQPLKDLAQSEALAKPASSSVGEGETPDIATFDAVARKFGEDMGVALSGGRLRRNYELDKGNIRSAAVASVDGCHGYTCEFASSPAQHVAEYDALEEMLTVALAKPVTEANGMRGALQIVEQRLALARITERYPPDTIAGRLAADALAKYPNRFENADRENDCEPFPIPEIEGLLHGPLCVAAKPVNGLQGLADIEGDEIVIRVPIATMQYAACGGMDRCNVEVTDDCKAAEGVVRYLNDEDEEGSTLIHFALDKALTKAVENGEEGFGEPPSLSERGERG